MEVYQWIFIALAIAGTLGGTYKWIITRNDKRRDELKTEHMGILKEHSQRLDRHSQRINRMDELIGLTRDDLHENYPKMARIEKIERIIDQKLDAVHARLGGISRDLNQMMGTVSTRHEEDFKTLVKEIRNALEPKL